MLKTLFRHFYYWFNILLMKIFLFGKVRGERKISELGNPGAAWKVPLELLNTKSIWYSAGVGEDISFEEELMKRKKLHIFLYDPTPRSMKFIQKKKLSSFFHYKNWGLWSKNTKLKFFAPNDKRFVSHSVVNLHNTNEYFLAKVKKLEWLMKRNDHQHIDALKIDIEGAEYQVLSHLLESTIRPKILLIEFDQPTIVFKTIKMVIQLEKNGYRLEDQTGWNYLFVYESTL